MAFTINGVVVKCDDRHSFIDLPPLPSVSQTFFAWGLKGAYSVLGGQAHRKVSVNAIIGAAGEQGGPDFGTQTIEEMHKYVQQTLHPYVATAVDIEVQHVADNYVYINTKDNVWLESIVPVPQAGQRRAIPLPDYAGTVVPRNINDIPVVYWWEMNFTFIELQPSPGLDP